MKCAFLLFGLEISCQTGFVTYKLNPLLSSHLKRYRVGEIQAIQLTIPRLSVTGSCIDLQKAKCLNFTKDDLN